MVKKNSGILVPMVIQKEGANERSFDIYSRLLKDRVVFLGDEVNDMTANVVVAQLLFLQAEDPQSDIHFYINSPGGSITAGYAILDTMKFMKPDVNTYCIGQACSMGAILLMSGTKGKRFALPHSRIMIHQPSSGFQGMTSDLEIHYKEVQKMKDELNQLISEASSQPLDKVKKDTDRDYFMSAQEAKDYGLIDIVVEKIK